MMNRAPLPCSFSWVFLASIVACGVIACSSAAPSQADQAADPAVAAPDARQTVDVPGAPDASTDATNADPSGEDVPRPKPPAGSAICGRGSFTQAQARAACAKPSTTLEWSPVKARSCSEVSLSGGSWEAWCRPDGNPYVYVRFDDVKLAASPSSLCKASAKVRLSRVLFDFASQDQVPSWVDYANARGAPTFAITSATPTTALAEAIWRPSSAHVLPPPSVARGTAFLMLSGCDDQSIVVGGAEISWNAQ